MKLMFSFFVSAILLVSAFNVTAGLGDQATTAREVVGEVRVQNTGTGATYYFVSEDKNWSASVCPNARYAYVSHADMGAKEIYAAALASRVSGKPISFSGTCGPSHDQYLKINYTLF